MKKMSKINIYKYEGERLRFGKFEDGTWSIENKEFECLGRLEKLRVGAWMTWCLFLNEDCYLSAGCIDEVREMIKILNAGDKKNV